MLKKEKIFLRVRYRYARFQVALAKLNLAYLNKKDIPDYETLSSSLNLAYLKIT